MNKSILYIYNSTILFELFKELEKDINLDVKHISKNDDLILLKDNTLSNFVILSNDNSNLPLKNNILLVEKWPIKFEELIQKINVFLLKLNYSNQSEKLIKDYKLDINSREMKKKDIKIKLTQKETEIILFLNNSKGDKTIINLQKKVWGHNSKLETHTVETHIYRLRKKIADTFNDNNFILSTENGYKI